MVGVFLAWLNLITVLVMGFFIEMIFLQSIKSVFLLSSRWLVVQKPVAFFARAFVVFIQY